MLLATAATFSLVLCGFGASLPVALGLLGDPRAIADPEPLGPGGYRFKKHATIGVASHVAWLPGAG